jgi:MinD-like ATPase involved in chromosome partitioning or flagellar assembly
MAPVLRISPMLQERISDQERNQSPVFLEGQSITGRPDLDVVIEGHARLRRSGLSVKADRIEYDQTQDLLKAQGHVRISRDGNRLDVLASDTDPHLSEAFDENDYNVVADIVSKYYSVVLTDCGTGIVHSVMKATLERANGLVIVSGGSFDEARLAAETLTWLESNGYADLVRNSVVLINTATQGTNLVKLNEIENHFKSRVREIVRMPYDPLLAAGSVVDWNRLKPHTRAAARELAALGHKVISLSVGEPDFKTPKHICDAAKKAIDDNYSHYTPVAGYLDLREAVCFKLKRGL